MTLRNDLEAKFQRDIVELRNTKNWLGTSRVVAILNSLDYLAGKYNATTVAYPGNSTVYVYMTLRELNGLKDESLAALLWSMENHNPSHTKTEDHPLTFARSYTYYIDVDGKSLMVQIRAEFKEESETCKRVIVGYEKPSSEPVPIYELQCSDDTAAVPTDAQESDGAPV